MTFLALRTSAVFGQEVLANAREYVVRTVLALPLGRVESASSGDLVTRVTRDVGTMAQTIRFGLPETVIAIITTLLTVAAMLLNSPLLTLPLLAVAPLLIVAARRYLKRAPQGYITEGGTYSVINSTLTETVEGARTVEALGLQGKRIEQFDVDIDVSAQAERYTMTLRNILFLLLGFVYDLPPLLVLIDRRLRLRQRLGHPGSDHRGGALRPGAGRAAAAADPDARQAPGRDRLDQPAAGHRLGARRTGRPARSGRPTTGWSGGTCGSRTGAGSTCCTASTWPCGRASGWPSSGRAGRASRPSAGCCPGSTVRGPGR
jgi:hypothetical protein